METVTTNKAKAKETIATLLTRIEALETTVKELKERPVRDRGPASQRNMEDKDAERLILGDLKETSHRKAAEELGLSYGQVYSARNGFTFKAIYQKGRKENEIS